MDLSFFLSFSTMHDSSMEFFVHSLCLLSTKKKLLIDKLRLLFDSQPEVRECLVSYSFFPPCQAFCVKSLKIHNFFSPFQTIPRAQFWGTLKKFFNYLKSSQIFSIETFFKLNLK